MTFSDTAHEEAFKSLKDVDHPKIKPGMRAKIVRLITTTFDENGNRLGKGDIIRVERTVKHPESRIDIALIKSTDRRCFWREGYDWISIVALDPVLEDVDHPTIKPGQKAKLRLVPHPFVDDLGNTLNEGDIIKVERTVKHPESGASVVLIKTAAGKKLDWAPGYDSVLVDCVEPYFDARDYDLTDVDHPTIKVGMRVRLRVSLLNTYDGNGNCLEVGDVVTVDRVVESPSSGRTIVLFKAKRFRPHTCMPGHDYGFVECFEPLVTEIDHPTLKPGMRAKLTSYPGMTIDINGKKLRQGDDVIVERVVSHPMCLMPFAVIKSTQNSELLGNGFDHIVASQLVPYWTINDVDHPDIKPGVMAIVRESFIVRNDKDGKTIAIGDVVMVERVVRHPTTAETVALFKTDTDGLEWAKGYDQIPVTNLRTHQPLEDTVDSSAWLPIAAGSPAFVRAHYHGMSFNENGERLKSGDRVHVERIVKHPTLGRPVALIKSPKDHDWCPGYDWISLVHLKPTQLKEEQTMSTHGLTVIDHPVFKPGMEVQIIMHGGQIGLNSKALCVGDTTKIRSVAKRHDGKVGVTIESSYSGSYGPNTNWIPVEEVEPYTHNGIKPGDWIKVTGETRDAKHKDGKCVKKGDVLQVVALHRKHFVGEVVLFESTGRFTDTDNQVIEKRNFLGIVDVEKCDPPITHNGIKPGDWIKVTGRTWGATKKDGNAVAVGDVLQVAELDLCLTDKENFPSGEEVVLIESYTAWAPGGDFTTKSNRQGIGVKDVVKCEPPKDPFGGIVAGDWIKVIVDGLSIKDPHRRMSECGDVYKVHHTESISGIPCVFLAQGGKPLPISGVRRLGEDPFNGIKAGQWFKLLSPISAYHRSGDPVKEGDVVQAVLAASCRGPCVFFDSSHTFSCYGSDLHGWPMFAVPVSQVQPCDPPSNHYGDIKVGDTVEIVNNANSAEDKDGKNLKPGDRVQVAGLSYTRKDSKRHLPGTGETLSRFEPVVLIESRSQFSGPDGVIPGRNYIMLSNVKKCDPPARPVSEKDPHNGIKVGDWIKVTGYADGAKNKNGYPIREGDVVQVAGLEYHCQDKSPVVLIESNGRFLSQTYIEGRNYLRITAVKKCDPPAKPVIEKDPHNGLKVGDWIRVTGDTNRATNKEGAYVKKGDILQITGFSKKLSGPVALIESTGSFSDLNYVVIPNTNFLCLHCIEKDPHNGLKTGDTVRLDCDETKVIVNGVPYGKGSFFAIQGTETMTWSNKLPVVAVQSDTKLSESASNFYNRPVTLIPVDKVTKVDSKEVSNGIESLMWVRVTKALPDELFNKIREQTGHQIEVGHVFRTGGLFWKHGVAGWEYAIKGIVLPANSVAPFTGRIPTTGITDLAQADLVRIKGGLKADMCDRTGRRYRKGDVVEINRVDGPWVRNGVISDPATVRLLGYGGGISLPCDKVEKICRTVMHQYKHGDLVRLHYHPGAWDLTGAPLRKGHIVKVAVVTDKYIQIDTAFGPAQIRKEMVSPYRHILVRFGICRQNPTFFTGNIFRRPTV